MLCTFAKFIVTYKPSLLYLCCKSDHYCYEPFTVNLLTKRAAKWCQKLFFNVNIESIVRRTQMQTMKGNGNSLFIIEKKLQGALHLNYTQF